MTRKLFLLTNLFLIVVLLFPSQIVAAANRNFTINRISKGLDGSQLNIGSFQPVISADGRFVVYSSNKLYLYDQKTGKTELVSVTSDGSPANGDVDNPTISSDGRYVAFRSNSTNIAGDLPGQVYLRDRKNGKTVLVSTPTDGSIPDSDSAAPSISGTGRYIAFVSFDTNLVKGDNNGLPDIFVKDMQQNKIYLASVSTSGKIGDSDSGVFGGPSISSDGRYVAFQSYATNLVQGDTNNASDIFVHDLKTGKTERVSVASNGKQGNDASDTPAISGNGRYVAFWSMATNLVHGDTNGLPDVFVHDRVTGKTERVSVASNGNQATGVYLFQETYNRVDLSSDGRYVTFSYEANNLAPGISKNTCDNNGDGTKESPCANVFVHDRSTGKTSLISVSTKNTAANNNSSYPSISSSGQWIAFQSDATNMITGDTNGQPDIYLYHRH
jgi:Tol biopolymer transport system component